MRNIQLACHDTAGAFEPDRDAVGSEDASSTADTA
jgi:hypothetical protein